MKGNHEINIFEHPAIVCWRAINSGDLEGASTIESGLDQIEFMALQRNVHRLIFLSDEISIIERHTKGHDKKKLYPMMQELLNDGVTIPIELMQRGYKLLCLPGKNEPSRNDLEQECEKQKIAGCIMALGDAKGRGRILTSDYVKGRGKYPIGNDINGVCLDSIARMAWKTKEGERAPDRRNAINKLLKSDTAKGARYLTLMTFKKCFSPAEIKAMPFPGIIYPHGGDDCEEYDKYDEYMDYKEFEDMIIKRRQEWTNKHPQECLLDFEDSQKKGMFKY